MRTALISGAGVAGATAAYWLAKAGFQVTVVEQARAVRSSGSPVDVHPQFPSIARMSIARPHLELGPPIDSTFTPRKSAPDLPVVLTRAPIPGSVDRSSLGEELSRVSIDLS